MVWQVRKIHCKEMHRTDVHKALLAGVSPHVHGINASSTIFVS